MRKAIILILLFGFCSSSYAAIESWSVGEGSDRSWSWAGLPSGLALDGSELTLERIDTTFNLASKAYIYDPSTIVQPDMRKSLTDGDFTTGWVQGTSRVGRTLVIDLGAAYAINRIEIDPMHDEEEGIDSTDYFLRGYKLVGGLKKGKVIDYSFLASHPENDKVHITEEFPSQYKRFIKLEVTTTHKFSIGEIRVFGKGSPPEVVYTSPIIDLESSVIFGQISLKTDLPEKTSLSLKTKSGASEKQYIYRTTEGDTVTKEEWEDLPAVQRGGKEYNSRDWSRWSSPYEELDEAKVISPGNRRYFQFQLVFKTEDPDVRPRARAFEISYSAPVAGHSLLGEIVPSEVEVGEVDTLDYYVLAEDITGNDTGFDGIEVDAPFKPEVLEVEIDGRQVEHTVEISNEGFRVLFTEDRIDESGELVRVQFTCLVTVSGTRFTGRAISSWTENFPQNIAGGDATEAGSGDGLAVSGFAREIVADFSVSPNPFSPNGDNIGDTAEIEFTLLQATEPLPVELVICDLSGEAVKEFDLGSLTNGPSPPGLGWDGTDENGDLVPPGAYLLRLSFEGDYKTFTRTGLISVVY